jgi:hypothetical protein
MEMDSVRSAHGPKKAAIVYEDSARRSDGESSTARQSEGESRMDSQPAEYRVYKRRWFGLLQLVLLNVIVSWDVSVSILYHVQRLRSVLTR